MDKILALNESVNCYYHKLDNGLDVYFVPNAKRQTASAYYTAKIGANTQDFKLNDTSYHLPSGVAHFLEHQLFNQPDGTDTLDLFEKQGAMANAWTSWTATRYYFSTTVNFEDNLKLLINFVNTPYFMQKSVNKERKIITEEHQMGSDNVYDNALDHLFRQLFWYHPCKNEILGTIKDIKSTTAEDLNLAHQAFYHPQNMYLMIVGNFDKEQILNLVEGEFKKIKSSPIKLAKKDYQEPDAVVKIRKTYRMNVSVPKLLIAYKINTKTLKDPIMSSMALEIYNLILFGKSSLFNEENSNHDLIRGFGSGIWELDWFRLWFFYGETEKPIKVANKISDLVNTKAVLEQDFNRIKKIMLAHYQALTDKNDHIAHYMHHYHLNYGKLVDEYQLLKNLSYNDFIKLISEVNLEHQTQLVVKPKK